MRRNRIKIFIYLRSKSFVRNWEALTCSEFGHTLNETNITHVATSRNAQQKTRWHLSSYAPPRFYAKSSYLESNFHHMEYHQARTWNNISQGICCASPERNEKNRNRRNQRFLTYSETLRDARNNVQFQSTMRS